MTDLPKELREVDWNRTTYAGVRREAMRRWAALPLDQIVASLEEMEVLAEALRAPVDTPATEAAAPAGPAPRHR